jgi:hypothetical protein
MSPDEALAAGVAILLPLLGRHEFVYVPGATGAGSGGHFAAGEFRRAGVADVRRLELHFRHSLGLVTYHVDDLELSHADYMRALGVRGAYPGFSEDPLDGFRHVLDDLTAHAGGFLAGPKVDFAQCVADAARRNSRSGFKRLSESP